MNVFQANMLIFVSMGTPKGPVVSQRLRSADWWKTLLPFSHLYCHFVPGFVRLPPDVFVSLVFKFSPTVVAHDYLFSDFILPAAFFPLLSSTCEELR